MTEATTWGDLELDDEIVDATGTVWRIGAVDLTEATEELSPAFRCKNQAGELLTISPKPRDGAVKVMPDTGGRCVALLRDKLGATPLATKRHGEPHWICERWPTEHKGSMAPFRTHLNLVHSIYADDIKTFAKLVDAHEAAHAAGGGIPHTH